MSEPNSRGRSLLVALIVACVALAAADFLYHKHGYLSVEKIPGFHGWFALATAVVLLAVGKVWRKIVMRNEHYYDD